MKMGIVMKKLILAAAVLAVTASSTLAADMAVKAKVPPPAPFDPWDLAFGAAIMNDYIFRGVTQSNHKPSVAVYFEPRYNFTKDFQAYIGVAGESISFPNRAAAEIDIYGGIRPTFGMFAFDIGAWGYLYPGGQCFNAAAFPGSGIPGSEAQCILNGNLPNAFVATGVPGNVAKRSASYSDTNLSKASCNAFTSDFSTTNASPAFVTAINPGNGVAAYGSNWCSATGIVKLSADLTAISNLK